MSYKIESPIPVIEGGTGIQAVTPYTVVCGGITNTGHLQFVSSVGTSGQVLTSNGPGALPTFAAIPGSFANSFPTDSGTATPSAGVLNIIANNAGLHAGSTVLFSGSGDTITFNVTDTFGNTVIGKNSGNLSGGGSNNTVVGSSAAPSITFGTGNVIMGQAAAQALTIGNSNVILGVSAALSLDIGIENIIIGRSAAVSATGADSNVIIGHSVAGLLGNGAENVIIGESAASFLTDGQFNVLIGQNTADGYTSNESSNICIGAGIPGTLGESNVLRIGNGTGTGNGQLNQTFISGIDGINVGSVATVVTEASNQLGTAVITAGTGITVTPSANTITIATTAPLSAITSIAGDTGGAQTGPAITLAGGTTGLSFGGSANTITTTFAGITANGGTVSLATDATTSTINVGTGAGAKTTTIGSTNTTSSTIIQGGSSGVQLDTHTNNGQITLTSGTGTIQISTAPTNTTLNIGTGAGVKTVILGSTNTTSTTTVQSGTGSLNITATNGSITMNSGTGTIGISNDATANTLNVGTGAGAKAVTVGSTNTTSSLALKCGTGNFSLVSATGTLMSAANAGSITKPLQPAFTVRLASSLTNVTGDGTFYSVVFDTLVYDQNSNINLAGPPTTFTAPVAGIYNFACCAFFTGLTSSFTDGRINLVTSVTGQIVMLRLNAGAIDTSGNLVVNGNVYVKMAASETAQLQVYVAGSTKTIGLLGDPAFTTYFSGALIA